METYKCIKKSYSYTGKLILDKSITISYTKEKINIHVVDYIIKKEVTKRQLVKRYEKLIKFITFYLANDDDSGVAYQEALNEINKYMRDNSDINESIVKDTVEDYIRLLAPLAPHFSEELWEKLGKKLSVHKEEWPEVKQTELNGGIKQIPVQVNGKLKTVISVDASTASENVLELIKQDPRVSELLKNYNIKKEIYVPNKIYNIVVEKSG